MAPPAKRRRSQKPAPTEPTDEEEQLVASLFGTKKRRVAETVDDEEDEGGEDYGSIGSAESLGDHDDEDLFVEDRGGQRDTDEQSESLDGHSTDGESSSDASASAASSSPKPIDELSRRSRGRKPVWTDPSSSSMTIALAGPKSRASDGTSAGTKKLRKLREEEGETTISGVEYEMRLRKLFEKFHPRPDWASASIRKSGGVQPQDKGRHALAHLLSGDSGLIERADGKSNGKEPAKLPESRLEVERLRNANEAQGRAMFSSIESLSFHPSTRSHLLMTTTKDRRLRFFEVDGKTNPILETIHIPELPLRSALFHPSGTSVLLSGPRPFFYAHDLVSGKTIKSTPWRGYGTNGSDVEERDLSNVCFQRPTEDRARSLLAIGGRRGALHLLEWGSVGGSGGGCLVGSLHMNAPLAGLAWHPTKSHSLVSLSTHGTIHTWDVRQMRCEVQRNDTGLFNPKGIKGSPACDIWAVGSESGIVNMYGPEAVGTDRGNAVVSASLQPRKSIKNITTNTSTMQYNHSGEILAIASDEKRDTLKMAHLPSITIFENWPTAGTPLGRVTSVDFSSASEYVAIGNKRGKVLLYSLRHFT